MKSKIVYFKVSDPRQGAFLEYKTLEAGYVVFESLKASKYSGDYLVEIHIEHPQQGWIMRDILFTNDEPILA